MAVLVTGEKLEILITEAEIASRINTLAEQISTAYEQTNQLVVIGLLRGSFVFIADLVRCLDLPVEVTGLPPGSAKGVRPSRIPMLRPAESESRSVVSIALDRCPTALANCSRSPL